MPWTKHVTLIALDYMLQRISSAYQQLSLSKYRKRIVSWLGVHHSATGEAIELDEGVLLKPQLLNEKHLQHAAVMWSTETYL